MAGFGFGWFVVYVLLGLLIMLVLSFTLYATWLVFFVCWIYDCVDIVLWCCYLLLVIVLSGVLLICCYHWFGFALWVSGLALLCVVVYCFVVGGLVVDLVFVV